MKFTVKQSDLSKALSTVGHAVSNRGTLPIIANVLLNAGEGKLTLSATNLEVGISCGVAAEIDQPGSYTLPAKLFTDLVGSLPAEAITLTLNEEANSVNIKSQRNSANIKGMSSDEFPQLPTSEEAHPIAFEAAQLKQAIAQTAIASGEDDSRQVFLGVNFEFDKVNERLTLAAADSFRLAVDSVKIPYPDFAPSEPLLIPAKTLTELVRILPNEGRVQMFVTPNRSQVLFHTEQVDLVSRLIDATFPNYRGILPKEWTTLAVLNTKEFASAVKSVMPFARDDANIVRVRISKGEGDAPGELRIEATAEDVGDNVVSINALTEGEAIEGVILNARYLADVLSVVEASEVVLEMQGPSRPIVLHPLNDETYTYLVMPMSTNR